uniref:O-acyltransferase like n=1 Tax=Myripristis murdjan TaxID=586833 RepID=A0A667X459_9TELE
MGIFKLPGLAILKLSLEQVMCRRGLLSAKSLLSTIRRAEDKMSLRLAACFLFKRLRRVQPLHLFLICLAMGVFSTLNMAANTQLSPSFVDNCKANWWANVLLINNFFTVNEMCLPWTWYLSMDFMFYITTPVLICIYRWKRSVFVAVAVILMLVTIVSSAVVTALYQLSVTLGSTFVYPSYAKYYYHKLYTRYGPFLIGIVMGIYMTTKKEQLIKHRWQAALGWVTCLLALVLLYVFAFMLQQMPKEDSIPHAIYQGLHRSVWALCVAWIILSCEEGNGGFINTLLSLGVWTPLSNISFACYLVHPIFITLYTDLLDTQAHYSDYNFWYLFNGNMLPTLVVSYALTVMVEKPFVLLKGRSE